MSKGVPRSEHWFSTRWILATLAVHLVESGGIFDDRRRLWRGECWQRGWEFPDEVMVNGVPYISANTWDALTIKIEGVVESYP